MQASYTGGAPGTPTYAWEFTPGSDTPAVFLNPVSSASQRVELANVVLGQQKTATFKCKVTDALGNFAYTPVCDYTYRHVTILP